MSAQRKATFGSISEGTLLPEDLVPAFADELRRIMDAKNADHAQLLRDVDGLDSVADYDDEAIALLEELTDALNAYAPDYGYFGAHPGDGSDFGFWLGEDWEQQARDDGVTFVNDLSEAHDDFRGLLCVVNDHGNATLYAIDVDGVRYEIWSIV